MQGAKNNAAINNRGYSLQQGTDQTRYRVYGLYKL